jgi:hypothetical protein
MEGSGYQPEILAAWASGHAQLVPRIVQQMRTRVAHIKKQLGG